MDAYNCVDFNPTLIDLFLPSYKIIYKFCLSTDKTRLFLISLARLCFWSIITSSLINNGYIGQENNTIVFLILVAYILINLFYIIILIFKRPTIDKKVMDRVSNGIIKEIKTKPLTLPTIIKQTP
ncbi:hypothetical protein Klosneuvirus_1_56 [Klosneuvirus KNV1]|uniref:Uncharacterized protein n=1 Tax=Klosneuvirus KNV1 TaxID=1977640 RepID=A0A1V0SHK1_9VIRU|nr:hypothetical protein Klosneuvirus_1_56 [Klosneuvirus KNV1]